MGEVQNNIPYRELTRGQLRVAVCAADYHPAVGTDPVEGLAGYNCDRRRRRGTGRRVQSDLVVPAGLLDVGAQRQLSHLPVTDARPPGRVDM